MFGEKKRLVTGGSVAAGCLAVVYFGFAGGNETNCYSTGRYKNAQSGGTGKEYVLKKYSNNVSDEKETSGLWLVARRLFHVVKHEVYLLQRAMYLGFLFFPLVALSPMCWIGEGSKNDWFKLLKWTLENAGPAFLKWGQWAATRPDLFSPNVCETLELLQTQAPMHEYNHTRNVIESSFGEAIETLFVEFEEQPVASGSIAQVHRAVLSREGSKRACLGNNSSDLYSIIWPSTSERRKETSFAEGSTVAVKVRHPGVSEMMECDFELMNRVASGFGRMFPNSLLIAQLKESLMQFGAPMRDQVDLRSEAQSLDSFAENFRWWNRVSFPLPATGLTSEDVLVESFEVGDHISTYLGKTCPYNRTLANLGMTCYLKMLLNDNLIHADLHPGNILVHLDTPPSGSFLEFIGKATGFKIEIPRIVLLDVGMTARLSENDQSHLVSFFESLSSLDGGKIAECILQFADKVGDAPAFKQDMATLFAALDPEHLRKNTQEVITDMMDSIRERGIQIPGAVSSVVITTMVLEGWSTKLNPDIRILESLKEMLPTAWEERMKKAVDNVLGDQILSLV
jgi:aarF domain-containing kinase